VLSPGRRVFLVDKPDRTQAQLRIGHLSARYGDPDTAALALAEAVFGGMFSSRLMQEIRVKRGWSYGAGCALRRSRLPHWFEIWTAAGIEVAGPAVALTLELLADYAAHGPTDDEVDFARSYLVGAMPFHVATARQRMQLAVRDAVFDLPSGYTARLPEALGQLAASDVRAACARHGIWYQGFSLLTANRYVLAIDTVRALSKKYAATPAQIVFRFSQHLDMVPLTGTKNPEHMKQDLAAAAIPLQPGDIEAILANS